ncbi:hypothetical protein [Pedobacter chitinilyticus]|uniref:Lipocalin-like domain-containing protein n=1 Tax=Pedobacter chitinilyticus TaxID=2233776 RepID=A0A3S3PYJ4_9SPHI|nr:hypothetical protein [Pedobacter chitinilyticus]RWU06362.1 hypothetical protein DPV69_13825 [Pedobacter chitinilyticus]
MKRTLFLLFIAFTTFTACKKDPQEKLEGRWNQTKLYVVQTSKDTKTEENITYKIGESYIVFSDNTFKSYQDGKLSDNGTFTATENSITLTRGESSATSVLRWNSKKEIVIIGEIHDLPSNSIKVELTFRKH